MYRAIVSFTDLQDSNYRYKVGDIFPRKGKRVSKKRIVELSGYDNLRRKPVIEEVTEEVTEDE